VLPCVHNNLSLSDIPFFLGMVYNSRVCSNYFQLL